VWEPGEEGRLLSVQGGSTSTVFDPDLENTYVRQATVFFEREVAANFGVRTGVVWNGRRQVRGTININRPLSAYSVPVPIRDPGPDGRLNTPDDGATFTAYNLTSEALARTPVNTTTILEGTDSDYYTWEITATKRHTARWGLLASFARTWSADAALGAGSAYTPNAFISADGEHRKSTTWQAKVHTTWNLTRNSRMIPIVRHQSGTPFARTFVQSLNWGTATILSEPINAQRTPNITVFDVRAERLFRVKSAGRITGFFDVYNIFNTNAEQAMSTSSGSSYLRPTVITAPRIARLGIKFDW
jgi:hypothetical protein